MILCFNFDVRDPGNVIRASWCILYIHQPATSGKPGDIKDDNLLGIPPHFLIETRGVMDSGVAGSTGPVC